MEAVRNCLLTASWHTLDYKEYLPVQTELSAIGNIVLRGTRIVIPLELRDKMLILAHEGHPGIVNMKKRLRTRVWWPGMDKQIEKFCKGCHGCQLVSQPIKPEPLVRTPLPDAPWKYLAADLLGPLPSGDYIFVSIDYYSRYFEIEITKVTSAEKIITILTKIFCTHGFPVSLRTDNGPQFVSAVFQTYLKTHGIQHQKTTPLWPQANGEVERQNRSLMKRICIAQAENRDWKSDLYDYLMMYRSTPHTTTGISPAELLYGRKIRSKLPEFHQVAIDDLELRDRDTEQKEKRKIYTDFKQNAHNSGIRPGDKVLVRQEKMKKFSTPFAHEPVTVVEKTGNAVTIETENGVKYKRNVTHVKPFENSENVSDSVEAVPSGIPSGKATVTSETRKQRTCQRD